MSYFETDTTLICLFLLLLSLIWMLILAPGLVFFRKELRVYRNWIYGIFAAALAVFTYSILTLFVYGVPFSRSSSPYDSYYLQYYKYPMLISYPGGGSDFSGRVELKNHFGQTIATSHFDIYHGVSDPDWTREGVSAGMEFDWKFAELPQ